VGIHTIEDPHTISSNHPRDAAVNTQLNSVSSSSPASVRPLIDAPACISARMRSGRATPPGHGSPKEPVGGLRKPPIL
jgi:hypothetical protein